MVAVFSDVTPSNVIHRLHISTHSFLLHFFFCPITEQPMPLTGLLTAPSPSSFPYHFHLFSQSPTLRMEAAGSYKMVVHVTSTNINYIWQAGGTRVTW